MGYAAYQLFIPFNPTTSWFLRSYTFCVLFFNDSDKDLIVLSSERDNCDDNHGELGENEYG
ncbi:MAG TPA: hypothetical protein DCE42_11235 [Myxococcales bacterium]|nr:hypothetical protein [Deltaproteobacteria bacterium]MBU54106.1 hypothetical protein [Deltaproteobacteria bacterium]HAA55322.1 hypothetical protein [Myxococcales bacterium]